MKTKIIFSTLISLSLLFGCSSNNSEDSSSPPPSPPSQNSDNLEIYQLDIKVEPQLAKEGLKDLDEIITPFDGINSNEGELNVLGGKNIVWGLDKSENILIGGVGVRGQPLILNAETTAMALLYTLLRPEVRTLDNIDEVIRGTSKFQEFTQAIEEMILKNKPIDDSEELTIYLNSIIPELEQKLLTPAPQSSTLALRALPINPSVNTDTNPHMWVDAITASIKIDSPKKKILYNFPIEMTINNGNIENILEANDIFDQLLLGGKTYNIPEPTNRTFELSVRETDKNYYENIWSNFKEFLLPFLTDKVFAAKVGECLEAAEPLAEGAEELIKISKENSLSKEQQIDYAVNTITSLPSVISDSNTCLTSQFNTNRVLLEGLKNYAHKYVKTGTKIALRFAAKVEAILASPIVSIQKTIFTINFYINRPDPITVCIDINNKIANCAASFETDPKSLVLIPGDELLVNLKSFTKENKLTILPNSIAINTEGVKFSSITLEKSKNAIKINPNNIGRESFKIFDEITEEKSDATIENIQPIFDKQDLVLLPNNKGQANLVDSLGRTIRFKKENLFEFSSSNTEVATVTGTGLAANITTKLPGTTTITAKNLATGNTSNLNLEVQYQDLNYVATLTESGTGECEDGTHTVTGTFKSLDPKTPLYQIAVRRVSFTTLLPTRVTRTLTYPEDGGTTRDIFTANIDFEGFSGSGSYIFTHNEGYTCSGRYTFEGKFLKEEN